MDLLCEPDDPAGDIAETTSTLYTCIEEWDGGIFRNYAYRKGKTEIIPELLRQMPDAPPADKPYTEMLYPTPKNELHPFLQTWLFFGLVAEMLGLNEVAPGVRLMDKSTADKEIATLHNDFQIRRHGSSYLTALPVLEWGEKFRERLALAPDKLHRMIYLSHCLRYCAVILHSIRENVDASVRYSIAALGELFSSGLYTGATLAQPKIDLPIIGLTWHVNYVKEGDVVDRFMSQNGWCPSEIEKIRAQSKSLFSTHYMSRLKCVGPALDHAKCTKHICQAFQMDIASYKPAHVSSDCDCENIEVDPFQVSKILRSTGLFPVIRVAHELNQLDSIEVFVEIYREDVPYVALSHVWANGLGNPAKNALPRCQLARLANLVANLPRDAETSEPYRLWIDTLCCPVDPDDKLISLQRIADVYRKADHVLVLDTTLTAVKYEDTHAAELLVRTFLCSPWMRRLWTLQEGALARTLQVQFQDRAVSSMQMITSLFQIAAKDVRYMPIWRDVISEFSQLSSFTPKTGPENTLTFQQATIMTLQRALHFRTVSVPSDEPLCISTLMNLDTKHISAAKDDKQRMVRVWEQLSAAFGGISSRLLFFMDEGIEVEGWHWAPRSLLASSAHEHSIWSVDERTMRFVSTEMPDSPHKSAMGVPTLLGFKVTLPGYRLVPTPRLPTLPLHPWTDVIHPTEDQILLQDERTGHWFRMIDSYRSMMVGKWTREQKQEYDRREKNTLCTAIDTGACALLLDQRLSLDENIGTGCLVQAKEVADVELEAMGLDVRMNRGALKARRQRTVIVSPLTDAESRMMVKVQKLADIVARDPTTKDFLEVQVRDPKSEDCRVAEQAVRQRMKDVMREAWPDDAESRQTLRDTVGEDLDDFIWVMIPKLFSHDVKLTELSQSQLWFID